MASLGDWIEDFHKSSKKWDPITHYALDGLQKASSKSVEMTSDGLATTADKWGWSSKFPRFWEEKADKDNHDFGRWGENTVDGIAAVFGGMYGADALGGGAGGSSAGGGSGGWLSGLSSGDGAMLVNEGGAGAGGGSWLNALSGGLKGGGNSMSKNAEQNQSSYDRRTAELLAEILREKKDDEPPGFINPNAMPASQKTYA